MDARELLRRFPVIDLHNDTLVAHQRLRNASLVQRGERYGSERNGLVSGPYGHLRPLDGSETMQIDLQGMREAGLDAGFFAVDVTQAHNNHLAYAMDALGFLLRDLMEQAADAVIVRSTADLQGALVGRRPAMILHIEHADVTEKSLNVLHALYALGVRSLGFTHNVSSCAADGCLRREMAWVDCFWRAIGAGDERARHGGRSRACEPRRLFPCAGGQLKAGALFPRQCARAATIRAT